MSWITDYKPADYSNTFEVADGDHALKIKEAKALVSKSGKNMIEVTYIVQDSNSVPFKDRIVSGDYFDANITRFFDAFGIDRGNFNMNMWVGKVGKARFEHRTSEFTDQNGQTRTANKAELVKLYTPDNVPQTQGYSQPGAPNVPNVFF